MSGELTMSDERLIAIAIENARTIFRMPDLAYDPALVFRDIRGFDSVQAVQFILAIEAALDVTLSEEEVDNMHTMGALITTLRGKTNPAD
jgi:acyl carrier protein